MGQNESRSDGKVPPKCKTNQNQGNSNMKYVGDKKNQLDEKGAFHGNPEVAMYSGNQDISIFATNSEVEGATCDFSQKGENTDRFKHTKTGIVQERAHVDCVGKLEDLEKLRTNKTEICQQRTHFCAQKRENPANKDRGNNDGSQSNNSDTIIDRAQFDFDGKREYFSNTCSDKNGTVPRFTSHSDTTIRDCTMDTVLTTNSISDVPKLTICLPNSDFNPTNKPLSPLNQGNISYQTLDKEANKGVNLGFSGQNRHINLKDRGGMPLNLNRDNTKIGGSKPINKTTSDQTTLQDGTNNIMSPSKLVSEKLKLITRVDRAREHVLSNPLKKSVLSGNPFLQNTLNKDLKKDEIENNTRSKETTLGGGNSLPLLDDVSEYPLSESNITTGMEKKCSLNEKTVKDTLDVNNIFNFPKLDDPSFPEDPCHIKNMNCISNNEAPAAPVFDPSKASTILPGTNQEKLMIKDKQSKCSAVNLELGNEHSSKHVNVKKTLKHVEMIAESLNGYNICSKKAFEGISHQKELHFTKPVECQQNIGQQCSLLQNCTVKMKNFDPDNDSVSLLQQEIINNLKQMVSFTTFLNSCPVLNAEIYLICDAIKQNLSSLKVNNETCQNVSDTGEISKSKVKIPKCVETGSKYFAGVCQTCDAYQENESPGPETAAEQNLDATDPVSVAGENKINTTPLNPFRALLDQLPHDLKEEQKNISLKNTAFYCRVCEKPIVFSLSNLIEHLRGKNHRAAIKSASAAKSKRSLTTQKNNSLISDNVTSLPVGNVCTSPQETFSSEMYTNLSPNYAGMLDIVNNSVEKGFNLDLSLFICVICDFMENNKSNALNHVFECHKNQENTTWHFCQSCHINIYGTDNHFRGHCLTAQHVNVVKLRKENSIKFSSGEGSTLKTNAVMEEFDQSSVSSSKSDKSNKSRQRLKPHEILLSIAKDKKDSNIGMAVGIYCQLCNKYSLYSQTTMNHYESEKHNQLLNSVHFRNRQNYKKYSCCTCKVDLFGDKDILKDHNSLQLHKELASESAVEVESIKLLETSQQDSADTNTVELLNEDDRHYDLMKKVLKKHFKKESAEIFYGFYCHLCQFYSLEEEEWKLHLNSASHGNRINSSECVGRRILYDCEKCNIRLICDEKFFSLHQQSLIHKAIARIPANKKNFEESESEGNSFEYDSDSSDDDDSIVDNDGAITSVNKNTDASSIQNKNSQEERTKYICLKKGIYLKGLPRNCSSKEVFDFFKRFGTIKTCKIDTDHCTGTIVFERKVDASIVLEKRTLNMKRTTVTLQPLMVKQTAKKKERLSSEIVKVLSSCQVLLDVVARLQAEMSHEYSGNQKKGDQIRRDLLATVPGSNVLFFGSQVTGLATGKSDFDIYIDFDGKSFFTDLSYNQQERIIHHLLFQSTQPGSKFLVKETILDARVPIIKVVHRETNTLCDISCRSGLSVENSQLIRLYLDWDPRVKWLVVAVKWWMNINGLLDRNIFTSYATVWLVLFFLMRVSPPVLCSVAHLQRNCQPRSVAKWDCRFRREIGRSFQTNNRQSYLELLTWFFHTYGTFQFRGMVLCPLNGMLLSRRSFETLQLPPEFRPYIAKIHIRLRNMPKFAYKAEALDAALEDVRNGMSKKAAAKKHGVPRSTLQFRLSTKFTKKELGPPPILTHEEEDILEKWVHDCCRKGFPRRKEDLQLSVQDFLNQNERPNPFKNNLPGLGWYQAFLKRHPNISLRTPEGVTVASSCVSENDIKNWFKNIEDVLKEENALNVLQDPARIFNGDETNFLLCPKGSKVLAPRGSKNVYEVDKGKAKSAVTAMFSFSADGKMVPPMLIYPYHRLPSTIVNSVPETWGIGHSDSGWMKAEVFYEYIGNVFNPHLVENNIKRPVILFVDGHKSHLSYKLSQLCSQHEIILIALYPNATRILQPADVAGFRPIKYGWKKAVMNWRVNHPADALTKENVALILDLVVKEVKPETLVNGFKACGLYPWNSKSIDFTKCLGKNQANIPMRNGNHVITLDQFEEIIGDEMLEKFNNIESAISKNCEPPLFFTLYRLWDEFSRTKQSLVSHSSHLVKEPQPCSPKGVTEPKPCSSKTGMEPQPCSSKTVTEPQPCSTKGVTEPKPCSSQTGMEPQLWSSKTVTEPQPCSSKTIINSESNKQISLDHAYATPEKKEVSNIEATTLTCIPQANEKSSQTLADILMWPVTPTRKGKKQTERVPYVVSSKKWRKLYEEKEEKKAAEERKKAVRKRIREEKKKLKDQKLNEPKQKKNVPNKTKIDKKYSHKKRCIDFTTVNNNLSPLRPRHMPSLRGKKSPLTDTKCGLCYSCGSNFKDDSENKPIECDLCDRLYHIKCVQNRPGEDIDDNDPVFICKPCLDLGNDIANELHL